MQVCVKKLAFSPDDRFLAALGEKILLTAFFIIVFCFVRQTSLFFTFRRIIDSVCGFSNIRMGSHVIMEHGCLLWGCDRCVAFLLF